MNSLFSDRYALVRELGRGGMATVYLAQDLKLQRQVALKVLRPELAASLGNDRFLREIEIAARLSHPHILPLHDSGDAGGHLYYAMPYVEGESLRQRLEREGQLPISETIAIVKAVASALTYAHQHGVVHRDIKPENILLAKDSEGGAAHPVVADFGIARALDAAGGERLTETGLALGTPAYMSPEQAAAGRVDERSDIYALGCVAYEMLAGQPPFVGLTAQMILARHAVDPVPSLHTVRATVPEGVECAISRALAKVPADRFSTADEFADAMMAEPRRVAPILRTSTLRSRKLLLGVAVASAVGVGVLLSRESASPSILASASRIAVLPFLSPGGDTGLTRLGRDLATTISASLDGVGGIETADRLSIATGTAGSGDLSASQGAALARRLGARSVVRGTLVRAGDGVRLDLALYGTEGLAPLTEGIAVTGHPDSIGMLTDSAAWALLRQIWKRGEPPSASLGAITTRSVPALRAFLEGERELGANRWEEAGLAFSSAIAADSTFWLAHFRYAFARWWVLETPEPAILAALRHHRRILPDRERLLAEPFLDSTITPRQRIEQFQVVTQRFPDYWPGWFLYADALFHFGPETGREWTEALQAFRHVVALNPKLVPAWEHIFKLTLGKDQGEASNAYARLIELGWLAAHEPWRGRFLRLAAGVGQAGGVVPPDLDLAADSLATFLATSPDEYVMKLAPLAVPPVGLALLQLGFPRAQQDLNSRTLRLVARGSGSRTASFSVLTVLRAADAWIWASRGQWDSALTIIGELASEQPGILWRQRYSPPAYPPVGGPGVAIESYALAVIAAWLRAASPALAEQRRTAAARSIDLLSDEESRRDARGRLAWFDGILGFARRDRRAIQAARRDAARSGYHQRELVDGSLAAFDLALEQDVKRAGKKIVELEDQCYSHYPNCNLFTPHAAVQRLAATQWLLRAGELDEAARAGRWVDGMEWYGFLYVLADVLRGPGYLARAQIEENRGDAILAREYYQKFLQRYDQPSPSQVHLVTEAKSGLARLEPDR